jgi:hypothetical protein
VRNWLGSPTVFIPRLTGQNRTGQRCAAWVMRRSYIMFQKELYNVERVYNFIQRTYTYILNYYNVAKHCQVWCTCTLVPNTATVSAPAVEIKMATLSGAEHAHCVFKGKFALSIATNLPAGLQFWILLRPDVLCAMPNHPVAHVFLTLQWNSFVRSSRKATRRASRETVIPNEPWLSEVKLGIFYYIMTAQNAVHTLWIHLYKSSKL